MAPISQFLPELTSWSGIGLMALVGGVAVLLLSSRLSHSVRYPPGIPLVGEPEGATRFSVRTRLRYYTDCARMFREAYENYAKKGKPVIIPGLGSRHEVILPPSSMRWVLTQPGEEVSSVDAFAEIDQIVYSLGHEHYVTDAWQGLLVRTELNAVLETICDGMNDELGIAFDKWFGTDTEWREIDLFSTVKMVVAQASSRFTVGAPFCRDEEYLKLSIDINNALILNAGVTGGTPRILKPLVGAVVNSPLRGKIRRLRKMFEPLWRERVAILEHDRGDDQEPRDHLQMMARFAKKNRPDEFSSLEAMTKRLAVANFGSMHQTIIHTTNMLLDVLGSDAEFNTVSVLRDEVGRVLYEDGNAFWTKEKVRKMARADSVARESVRLNSFGGRALMRKIMVDGCETPEGWKLPRGNTVSFLSQPAATDADKFEDPFKYDPFRFSRMREDAEAKGEKAPAVSFVTTGPDYLPFGHGRHACPGRFLVDFELKMIIAYVVNHYDVEFPPEYNGRRPPNYWLTEALFPPDKVKIRIRRRAGM